MTRILALCATTLVLLSHSFAYAASCKYEKNSIDKFTKIKVVQTDWERLTALPKVFSSASVYVSGLVDRDQKYLSIKFAVSEFVKYRPRSFALNARFSIPDGAELLLLLADDSLITLHAAGGISIDAEVKSVERLGKLDIADMKILTKKEFQIDSGGILNYALDESDIAALVTQDVIAVRLAGVRKYTDVYDEHLDFLVRDKSAGEIRKTLECIL